jgi:bifunctional non-homologous end joining protein LigD
VPLNTPVEYSVTQPFARTVAELLAKEHPDQIVSEMARSERIGKVFIDWSQNADFKTAVGVYSLRAKRSEPFVSLPVTWEELSQALCARDSKRLYFEPELALEQLEQVGDLFEPVLSLNQSLPGEITENIKPKKRPPAYAKKRNFSKTPESTPDVPRASGQGAKRRFVVQKHAATHLHYDFRLEMHAVLKSWAVPKGVPYKSGEKRLAMATEDHPIEYLDFEGNIPKGQYGRGTVMVWDIGTYELMEGNYYKGNLQLFLEGKRLKGEWALTKDPAAKDKNWSLLKIGSPMKHPDAAGENTSALTGRTLEQIASDNDAQWQSNRTLIPDLDLDKLPQSAMTFIEPMQPKLAASLPEGDDWDYEVFLLI